MASPLACQFRHIDQIKEIQAMNKELTTDLIVLIEYILENEGAHFFEYVENGGLPENHIFAVANRILAAIGEGASHA